MIARCALSLACLVAGAAGANFLTTRAQVAREDVRQFLLSELSGQANTPRLESIENDLRSTFAALPKSETGRLEAGVVRFALHRYFVQRHGWYVKGLDGAEGVGDLSTSAWVLKARAPAYIQKLFREELAGGGLGLHELAVFAATLEDLIHVEAAGDLEWIYAALGLPTVGPISLAEADSAIHYFAVAFLTLHGEAFARNKLELWTMEQDLQEAYPDYVDTNLWLQDLRRTYEAAQVFKNNPFVERTSDFEETVGFAVDEFGHRFGSFQNLECHKLKGKLLDIEHQGTGRVLLSTFYSQALAGTWEFSESVEYLRNQGALDETDPNRPSVVIANYLNSRANCLTGSDFYAVCCMDECEGLMRQLEEQLASPSAAPKRIAEVVSTVHSDTVDAPRNLSGVLLARLDEVARFHGGLVPLHGRLFAQWMHHAYPRECLFPHVSGTMSPLTPPEFAEKMGAELLDASEDVMKLYASQVNATSEAPEALPWTFDEELVGEGARERQESRSFALSLVRALVALAALASFAVPLAHAFRGAAAMSAEGKVQGHLV